MSHWEYCHIKAGDLKHREKWDIRGVLHDEGTTTEMEAFEFQVQCCLFEQMSQNPHHFSHLSKGLAWRKLQTAKYPIIYEAQSYFYYGGC
jgi:hypothetical protein